MRNPSSAKNIAPKSGVRFVTKYESLGGHEMQVYLCDDIFTAQDFQHEQQKLGHMVGRVDCRVVVKIAL